MMDGKQDYLELLRAIYETRNKANAGYSLRAFARSLNLDPGELSRIITGKKYPSLNVAYQIADQLKLSKEGIENFVLSVLEKKNRRSLERMHAHHHRGQHPQES